MIRRFSKKISLNKLLIILGASVLLVLVGFLIWWNHDIEISGNNSEGIKNVSSISGEECDNYLSRPISVMLASDPEPRPLSAIGQADIVFEMPVTPDGITRFMAIYQCEQPKEIGSIRSARKDFVPLAASFDSIYAHWGGEHGILDELKNHIIDNLNALVYDGSYFYRKSSAKPPHNGFTNYELIEELSNKLDYDLNDKFEGYPHLENDVKKNINNIVDEINIAYAGPYAVRWDYDTNTNLYKRSRGGSPEIDKNTGEQVTSRVVIEMMTTASDLYDQYINVDVYGQGQVKVYQGGIVTNGTWKKDPSKLNSKLFFLGEDGKEIKFLPGKIWVEITVK